MPAVDQLSLPTTEQEVWRYSRIDELQLDRYEPAPSQTEITAPDGLVTIGAAPQLTVHDVFDELNEAHADPLLVTVPAGRSLAEPVLIEHRFDIGAAAYYPRLVIDAGADCDVTVIETFTSPDELDALVVPRLQIRAGNAARVNYIGVNLLGRRTWQIAHQEALGERDSTVQLATVALGGDYARVRTDAKALGQGATTRQVAVYYADGTQMHDFRTMQDHVAPRTNSDLLFKGAVQDTAKSVYTGLIRIGLEAKGSVAFQTNRNLTLSKGAWAESVPNLDIATNDVKCSHASSVGPVDDEQRFYLESRGIPPEIAERLVVLGFFDEVLDQLPVDARLRAELHQRVADKLVRRSA